MRLPSFISCCFNSDITSTGRFKSPCTWWCRSCNHFVLVDDTMKVTWGEIELLWEMSLRFNTGFPLHTV